MIQRSPTPDVIDSIVSNLSFNFDITSATDNLDGTYTLTTCQTYHLQPGFKVTIGSFEYKIISVARNVNIVIGFYSGGDIVVDSAYLPTATTFAIYTPYFFHGTPNDVSNELTQIKVSKDKTPMVYLSEEYKEQYFGRGSSIDRTVPCRIFFLTQSETGWLTEKFHSDAIQPMTDLALLFVDECRNSTPIGKFEESGWEIIPRQRVSIESSGKGKKNFASECLSGVELNIDLPIMKGNQICPCTIIVLPTGFTYEDLSALTYEEVMAMTYEELMA